MTDVRDAGDLSDYTGELQGEPRRPDHRSQQRSFTDPDPATSEDAPFPITVQCVTTALIRAPTGGNCSLSSSLNAIAPGAVVEGKRAIWELGPVEVFDGGADGLAATTPNALFARQGIFVP